jgi:hypothetical protein
VIDRKEIDRRKMVVRSIFTKRDITRHTCNLNLFFELYQNRTLLEKYQEYGEVAIISKDKIIKLLEEKRFEIENVYGDFDLVEYQRDSPRIVLVTKKK